MFYLLATVTFVIVPIVTATGTSTIGGIADPYVYTCGTNSSQNDNIRGFVIVDGFSKLARKCITLRRWDSRNGMFSFNASLDAINATTYDYAHLVFTKYEQESMILGLDWHLSPSAQIISFLYSHDLASKCHPSAKENTFYCYDGRTKMVRACNESRVDQGHLSILYEFNDDWTLFKKTQNSGQASGRKKRLIAATGPKITRTPVPVTAPGPFAPTTAYQDIVNKETTQISDLIKIVDSLGHPCAVPATNGYTSSFIAKLLVVIAAAMTRC